MNTTINLSPGMRFGVGVESLTNEVRAQAIDPGGETTADGGQFVTPSITIVQSQRSLIESMNLGVEATFQYGMVSADAKFQMSKDQASNAYSNHVVLSSRVTNPPRRMVAPKLTPDAERIYKSDPEKFRNIYGDCYVEEVNSGGEFYALFTFDAFDSTSDSSVKASLNVGVNAFLASGSIHGDMEQSFKEASKSSVMSIHAVIAGGSGVKSPTSFADLVDLYNNFNKDVAAHPIDYTATLKPFKYLPLPDGPCWAEQAVRGDTISECSRRILDAIQLRGSLEFILRYPHQFESFDAEKLRAAYASVDALLPKLAKRARDCASNIDLCTLDGVQPVMIDLPQRLANAGDPLDVKLQDVLQHDSHAAPFFGIPIGPLANYDRGPGGIGRYKLFGDPKGNPIGGIFWRPDLGASVVYGSIFAEYFKRGTCSGPLGFPMADETTVTGAGADGLDRVSVFENGSLFWDQQTNRVTLAPPAQATLTVGNDRIALNALSNSQIRSMRLMPAR